MESLKVNLVLDTKGLACPMPVVKTRRAMNELAAGQVLEVQATDKGSIADIKAWSKSSGHQYLGMIEENKVLKHFIRKSSDDETIEIKHPHIANNQELEKKLQDGSSIVVLDVREAAEYAFNHIPNAISIPLGELAERMGEFNKQDEIYVVCRTGNRSDVSAQLLAENDFAQVINVVPGMCEWSGETTGINSQGKLLNN